MNVNACIAAGIEKYGNTVTVTRNGESVRVKAFVEPMRRRHRPYINEKALDMGRFENGYRLYIGDKNVPLEKQDTVATVEGSFTVVMSEQFYFQDENLYVWGILEEKKPMRKDDFEDDGADR